VKRLLAFAVGLVCSSSLWAYSDGNPNGGILSACQGCHNAAGITVSFNTTAVNQYPGQTATYSINISKTSGTSTAHVGANVHATGGTFTIPMGEPLAVISGEVIHRSSVGTLRTLATGSTSYSFIFQVPTSATPGSSSYTINGVSAAGHNAYSNLVGTAIAGVNLVVSAIRPSDPTNLNTTSINPNSISLSWSGTGPAYRLLYKTGSYPSSPTDGTATAVDVSGTSTTVSSLTASTTYYFAVYGRATFAATNTFSTSASQVQATTSPASDPNPWVDAVNGNDSNYGDQSAPFKTITRALQAVGATGSIRVKPGTYNTALGETFPLTIPSGRTLRSTNGASLTVIDATGANTRVLYCNGNSNTTLVEGFTITGGLFTRPVDGGNANGGGIFTENNDQTTFSRCIITGNELRGYSATGGSYISGGLAYGGGVSISSSQTKLTNCVISNNIARGGNGYTNMSAGNGGDGGSAYGGGVYAFSSTTGQPVITNCTFNANQTIGGNGGTATVSGNGGNGGGALYTLDGNSSTIINNIFSNNTAVGGTGGSPGGAAGTPLFGGVNANNGTNNLFFNNTNGDGFTGTNALTGANPLYVNPPGDLHLRSSSPARRAGTSTGAPTVDLDGNPRTSPPTIGAYEIGLFLTATGGLGRITLTWPGVSGASSYNLYLKSTAGVTTMSFDRKISGATSPYVLLGLPNNTTYYFVITAIENSVEGPISPEVSATTANGTWAKAGILPGTGFTNLTSDLANRNTLYATANDSIGLYKSTDAGDTWAGLTGPFNGSAMRAVAANGSTVIVGGGGNIYRSTNGGSTWATAASGNSAGEPHQSLQIDPLAALNVYGGDFLLSGQGFGTNMMVKSTDGGATFSNLPSGSISAYYVQVDPTIAGTVYEAGSGTPPVGKSTNGGTDWTDVKPVSCYPTALALAPSQSLTLYAGLRNGSNSNSIGVYKTTNGATNWNQMNNGLPPSPIPEVDALLVDPANANRVHAGTDVGYYSSTDGAANWVAGPSGAPYPSASLFFNAFAQTTTGRLIGTTSNGIFMLALSGPPAITNASPSSGSTSGGDSVTINGTGFVAASGLRVLFDGIDGAVNLGGSSSTAIAVTTPAHASGAVDVTVINPDGQSAIGTGGFTYTCPSSDISPTSANYSSAAATGTVSVLASESCAWAASAPGGSFVTITGGSSGNGPGTVSYSVTQNSTGTSRSTTLTIAGKSFVVTQSAAGVAAMTLNAAASASQVSLSWNSVGANSYEIQRSNNGGAFAPINSTVSSGYTDSTVANGTGYLYRIRALGSGGEISYSNVDLAVPFAYTYPTITTGVTIIHAADVLEQRQVINAARAALGWPAMSFTDPVLTGVVVKAVHFTEMRTGINGARAGVGLPAVTYTYSTLTPNTTVIHAADVTEMRPGLQ
jgi:hypothetical protein